MFFDIDHLIGWLASLATLFFLILLPSPMHYSMHPLILSILCDHVVAA